MAQPYELMELESTLKLAINLCEFRNLAFDDATALSRINMNDLNFWVDHAKPVSLVLEHLNKLDGLLPNISEMIGRVIAVALDVLKTGTDIGKLAWIEDFVDGVSELILSLLQVMSQSLSELVKQMKFSGESTQIYFRHLREIVMSIDILKKSIVSEYFIGKHFDLILSHSRLVIDRIALVAATRITSDPDIGDVKSLSSVPALNLIDDDLVALRLIGFYVHELAAYAVSSYKYIHSNVLHS
jgi:hypothetical protein